MTTRQKSSDVHVLPAKGRGFVVRVAGSAETLAGPTTQRKAIDSAIRLARVRRCEVVIHRADGRIRDKDSYGPDSPKVRDTRH